MLELVSFSGYLGPNMWILLDNTLQIYIWTLLGRFLFRNIALRGAVRCEQRSSIFKQDQLLRHLIENSLCFKEPITPSNVALSRLPSSSRY